MKKADASFFKMHKGSPSKALFGLNSISGSLVAKHILQHSCFMVSECSRLLSEHQCLRTEKEMFPLRDSMKERRCEFDGSDNMEENRWTRNTREREQE